MPGVAFVRKHFLPFASPSIGEEEIAEVVETLRGGWLTTGPRTRRFEEQLAEYVGASFAVAVNSCTAALHLALESIGTAPGDEVITTPMTFAATGEVIRYLGATPVFVDIDPVTMNLDPTLVVPALNRCKHPRAILPVHIAGLASEMDAITTIAASHGVRIVEDAAHTLPTKHNGRMIGSIGDVSCFSFYSTKTMTTGEGGMATTNDADLAERMRIMSLHGISKDAWKRYTAQGSWYYEILAPGYKYNMPDIMAALGLVQLRRVEEMYQRRADIARQYTEAFAKLNDFVETPPDATGNSQHAWHLYIIKLHLDKLSIDRDAFIEEMKQRNIGCSVHFIPLHLHPYYREQFGFAPADFPNAYSVYKRIVSLPIYPKMTDDDVNDVIAAVTDICRTHTK